MSIVIIYFCIFLEGEEGKKNGSVFYESKLSIVKENTKSHPASFKVN